MQLLIVLQENTEIKFLAVNCSEKVLPSESRFSSDFDSITTVTASHNGDKTDKKVSDGTRLYPICAT